MDHRDFKSENIDFNRETTSSEDNLERIDERERKGTTRLNNKKTGS